MLKRCTAVLSATSVTPHPSTVCASSVFATPSASTLCATTSGPEPRANNEPRIATRSPLCDLGTLQQRNRKQMKQQLGLMHFVEHVRAEENGAAGAAPRAILQSPAVQKTDLSCCSYYLCWIRSRQSHSLDNVHADEDLLCNSASFVLTVYVHLRFLKRSYHASKSVTNVLKQRKLDPQ